MIYDINKTELTSAYDSSANELETAYDLEGNRVYSRTPPPHDYDDYTISTLFAKSSSGLSGTSFQAFDIYNGVIVQARHQSIVCLFDMATQTVINSGMACEVGHGNGFSLSRQFYDDEDEFPLAYASTGYKYVYVNRITRSSSTLIKTYKTDPTVHGGYVMCSCPSEDGKTLYTLGYTFEDYQSDRGGTNLVKIATWNLENETDNGDGTFTPEFVQEATMPFILCIQGCQFHDNQLFVSSGITASSQNIYVIDPETATINHTINLGNTIEVEGCAWVDDEYMVVGQDPFTVTYKKIEFGEL